MAGTDVRTYHTVKDAAYILPNDASEHERLKLQTQAINRMMFDQPIQAPLNQPARILEVGCGTGHMTTYLASKYPNATTVIGIDLSAVPPQEVESNATFLEGDFRQLAGNPAYPSLAPNSFDYIFSRMLVYGMTDWPAYISQAKSLLVSGGWLEVQDLNQTYYDQDKSLISGSWKWLRDQTAAWAERGLDLNIGSKLERYMTEAGFEDVQVSEYRWIYGKWFGHPETDMIGEYSPKYLIPAGWGAYEKVLGPNKTEGELKADFEEMESSKAFSEDGKHQGFYVVCGRKP